MKVLIAVDETSIADEITQFAIQHNWPPGTPFLVMHVIEPFHGDNLQLLLPADVLEEIFKDRKQEAVDLVRRSALKLRDAFKSPHIEESVVEGKPKEEILKAAKDWKADLILIGSHGKHGLDRLLLGSVSLAVVSQASCAVLVVRPSK